jgi:hypothetical protein
LLGDIRKQTRQNHFSKISGQAEVEIHVLLMLYPRAVTSQGLVARRCMQILTRLDCIGSRAALTHGEVLNMISAARVFIQREEDPRGCEGAVSPIKPTLALY